MDGAALAEAEWGEGGRHEKMWKGKIFRQKEENF